MWRSISQPLTKTKRMRKFTDRVTMCRSSWHIIQFINNISFLLFFDRPQNVGLFKLVTVANNKSNTHFKTKSIQKRGSTFTRFFSLLFDFAFIFSISLSTTVVFCSSVVASSCFFFLLFIVNNCCCASHVHDVIKNNQEELQKIVTDHAQSIFNSQMSTECKQEIKRRLEMANYYFYLNKSIGYLPLGQLISIDGASKTITR